MLSENDLRETCALDPYRTMLREFEAAWLDRRDETNEPCIDDFLSEVPDRDRPHVRSALESLAIRLRGNGNTIASIPVEATSQPSTASDSTLVSQGHTAVETSSDPDTTQFVDTATADSTAADNGADFDMTLDPSSTGQTSSAPADSPGSFDDYDILAELGRGGMGVVYKAREKSTQRIVCIKMILGGEYASKDALRRFRVETEAAAHLDHPNIVPVYRAGVFNGMPYFAMRFIDGRAMDSIDRNEFNDRTVIALMTKICRAIEFAHSRGILHRDLKPANILLDENGEPHITDFGLAKRMNDDSGQTHTGLIMGTPDYMSPEQAVGAHDLVSVTSDVYSLGSILFDMLTGQPPFKSATIVETLSRVTKEPARTPTTLNQRVGKDLETICLKCLEKDPNKRYRSAASLADELDRYLRGEPIKERPVGSAEKLWRWCRRNPGIATMAAMLLVMLVAAAVGSTIAAYQINQRRNEAVLARADEELARQSADEHARKAEAHAKIADEQRSLALDTLHNLVTKVEAKLRDRPDLADLQRDVLQDAVAGLQEVSRTAENSGRADRTVGVAHQRMADILEQLGKNSESMEEHRKAISIFESLIQDDKRDDWAKWNAAISYDKLGDRQLSTDKQAATEYYRKSIELREMLATASYDEDLADAERQRSVLISTAKAGSLALQQGNPQEARRLFEKALKKSETMLKNDPTNNQLKQAVAGSCSLLGRASFSLCDLTAAHTYCHRALDLRKELHSAAPTSVSATASLAGSYDALGDVELQTDQTLEARRYYTSSVTLLEELFAKDKANAAVKGNLSTLYYKLATTLRRLDEHKDAENYYAKCLKLREELFAVDPDDPDKQISLMLAQARCGLHQDATELARQLRENASDNAGSLFYVACGFALGAGAAVTHDDRADAALTQAYTDSAIIALEQAIELGYRDVAALKMDPDLDPIRADSQFQRLLKTVDAHGI